MKSSKTNPLIHVGVLAFQGDVAEHINALEKAAQKLKFKVSISSIRTKESLVGLDGLIIPGGESTTLFKLCDREGMIPGIKKIKNIFGTCAGAILLSKNVSNLAPGQKTLALMDTVIVRNAYGSQSESFTKKIKSISGDIDAVFIRAPRIKNTGKKVVVLSEDNGEIIACEEKTGKNYCLTACFHPELTTTVFHEYFLKQI